MRNLIFLIPGAVHAQVAANERFVTTFRFEMFNAFNHVNPGNPNTARNNANFMRITRASDSSIPRLALRLVF